MLGDLPEDNCGRRTGSDSGVAGWKASEGGLGGHLSALDVGVKQDRIQDDSQAQSHEQGTSISGERWSLVQEPVEWEGVR